MIQDNRYKRDTRDMIQDLIQDNTDTRQQIQERNMIQYVRERKMIQRDMIQDNRGARGMKQDNTDSREIRET